jgi:NAD(P)-dependent dehydrogenase (short-subunit alcohol dehydrogenase family)
VTRQSPQARAAQVTGASRCIGAATAVAVARRGIAPALALGNPASAQVTQAAVQHLGVACRVLPCDVSNKATVRQAVAATPDARGRLDMVINNAGCIGPIGRLGDTDPQAWIDH